jgi:hypothetical protein
MGITFPAIPSARIILFEKTNWNFITSRYYFRSAFSSALMDRLTTTVLPHFPPALHEKPLYYRLRLWMVMLKNAME